MKVYSELEAFLKKGLSLKYEISQSECGQLTLKNYSDLTEEIIEVELEEDHYSSVEQLKNGPYGHYKITAVNLIESCQAYFPDHIILWLPHEESFGTFDTDHSRLSIFENIEWSHITKNPLPYINSQWNDHGHQISKPFDPRGKYEIIYEI